MSYYRQQLETWLSKIDVLADFVIDVGGGEKPIPNRVNSWEVKEYKILDNDPKFYPDFEFDINYIMSEMLEGKADIVFCLEVMEYVWNPYQAHKNLSHLLKKGGILYVSYPTMYPLHAPEGIDYLRYTKNAIQKHLTVAGFAIEEIVSRPATVGGPNLEAFYHKEGLHPLKGNRDIFDVGYLVKARKE